MGAPRQLIQSRAAADFDETIRGYRTVEDTRTGQRFSVDLGRVHDFVERRNARDPGRFREIPLRDEACIHCRRASRGKERTFPTSILRHCAERSYS